MSEKEIAAITNKLKKHQVNIGKEVDKIRKEYDVLESIKYDLEAHMESEGRAMDDLESAIERIDEAIQALSEFS